MEKAERKEDFRDEHVSILSLLVLGCNMDNGWVELT